MNVKKIAIPLFRGKRRFHIKKGRQWSPVEHALLEFLATRESTAGDLSTRSQLPRRVVIEVLIRLMRVGWVEVSTSRDGSIFRASARGRSVLQLEELPIPARQLSKTLAFYFDRVTATPFRGRDFPLTVYADQLKKRPDFAELVVLPITEGVTPDPSEFQARLAFEDELIVGFDSGYARPSEMYAIVRVENGAIEGAPESLPSSLRSRILAAASESESTHQALEAGTVVAKSSASEGLTTAVISADDLIVGAAEHRRLMEHALRKGQGRVVIHSTFLREECLTEWLPLMKQAASRGVRVDILWGQAEESEKYQATLRLIDKFTESLRVVSLDSTVVIHQMSTGSHSKILIWGEGEADNLVGAVGSCNWLYSGYTSFDVSVRVRDPKLVAAILNTLARLSQGKDGYSTKLSSEFSGLAMQTSTRAPLKGMKCEVALVRGPQHADFIRRARDEASKRMVVASHRIGVAAERCAVFPAVSAVEARGIAASLYFGITTGAMSEADAKDLIRSAAGDGVGLCPIHEPKLHAKFLAWDDDNVLITSQNLLSADPSPNDLLSEIGIFLSAPKAADNLVRRLEIERRA